MKEEHKDAIEVSVIFHEGQRMFAVPKQPALVQEPVVFYRCNGCGHAYEQVHPTSCDCMEAGGFDRVEYYTTPPEAEFVCSTGLCHYKAQPDWKAEYLKSVESGCITLDELRETLAELEATNRQVEILSDALAESRREVAALKSVQEPMAWGKPTDEMVQAATDEYDEWSVDNKGTTECIRAMLVKALKATPPAAQRQWVSLTHEEVMDSWDEIRDGDWAPDFYEVIEAKLKERNGITEKDQS